MKAGRQISEGLLLALFLTPFLQSVAPQHPFLGEREKHLYARETIRWAIDQIFTPFSFPRGSKETAHQILTAQSNLKKSIHKGVIPHRFRAKKYFQETVLLYGIEAQAKGRKIPGILRNVAPSDLLPWWPKELKGKDQGPGWRSTSKTRG